MEKYFCDFCKNEVKIGDICKVYFEEPQADEYPLHTEFDACKDCIKKIKSAIGIKP